MPNDQGQRPMPENPGRLLPFLPYYPIRFLQGLTESCR